MTKQSVQILFTNDEYKELEKEAVKQGVTVPLYIKGSILKNDDFTNNYKKLIEKIDQISQGTRFTIKMIFGTDWNMRRGIKLQLGKTFFNAVSSGIITNVKALEKDSSNVMWYEKL